MSKKLKFEKEESIRDAIIPAPKFIIKEFALTGPKAKSAQLIVNGQIADIIDSITYPDDYIETPYTSFNKLPFLCGLSVDARKLDVRVIVKYVGESFPSVAFEECKENQMVSQNDDMRISYEKGFEIFDLKK